MQTNVRKTGKTNVEIFYIVSVRMPGEIFLEDQKVGKYRPDRNQVHLFFVCLIYRRKTTKAISVKVTSIVMDIQFIDDTASDSGIKTRLVA